MYEPHHSVDADRRVGFLRDVRLVVIARAVGVEIKVCLIDYVIIRIVERETRIV